MTVKELIEALKEYDENMEVMARIDSHFYSGLVNISLPFETKTQTKTTNHHLNTIIETTVLLIH